MVKTVSALLLFIGSCICTVRTRFVPFRRLGASVRGTVAGSKVDGISPYAASATSLAATLGTGNIAGVAGAIVIGGPGAVFWMWMSALAGMGAKYCDIYYGIRYRMNGSIGPMAYMKTALPKRMKALSYLYAALCAIGCLCMGNLVQVNAMAEACNALLATLPIRHDALVTALILGVCSALFVGAVNFGGARRIGNAASCLVPIMSIFYIGAACVVLMINYARIPQAFFSILRGALEPRAFLTGIARGTFSHEAGLGTAAIAHGGVQTQQAHKQALFGVFEVFFDTIVMCSITAVAILTAMPSVIDLTYTGQNGAVVIEAFSLVLGKPAASWCITASLVLFALTSVLTFSHYGGVCARYLFSDTGGKVYRILFLCVICIGGIMTSKQVWRIAEGINIAMGLVNMTAMMIITAKRNQIRSMR